MDDNSYTTSGGITVHRTAVPCDPRALADLTVNVEQRRGGVLSSGMEYPGRYSRWHLGYVDPCLEVVARGRTIGATALNDRGRVLLPAVARALTAHGAVVEHTDDTVAVTVPEPDPTEFFTEEERAAVSVSALAPSWAFFHGRTPPGAAGRSATIWRSSSNDRAGAAARPGGLGPVLHLPDEIIVHDRKRSASATPTTSRCRRSCAARQGRPRARRAAPTPR